VENRYCRNCGHELGMEDRFCPNCGQPAHETAHVPTPDADVEVPPQGGQPSVGPAPQQAETPPQQQGSWVGRGIGGGFGASIGWTLGSCLVIVVVCLLLFAGCAALIAIGSSS
jgi:uncharacterized membrane protein